MKHVNVYIYAGHMKVSEKKKFSLLDILIIAIIIIIVLLIYTAVQQSDDGIKNEKKEKLFLSLTQLNKSTLQQ